MSGCRLIMAYIKIKYSKFNINLRFIFIKYLCKLNVKFFDVHIGVGTLKIVYSKFNK